MTSKIKNVKRLISLLIVLIMMIGMASFATIPSAAAEDRVNDARNSVGAVLIYFEDSDVSYLPSNETVFSLGSGFFVGDKRDNPEYLITNYHVVSTYYENGSGKVITATIGGEKRKGRLKIRVYFDTVSSNDFIEAYPVEVDDKYDLALLRLEYPTNKRKALPIISPDDSLVGKKVCVLGFPGLTEKYNIGATSHFKVSDVSVTSGIVSRLFTQQGTGWKNIIIDASIKEGNSGGPLITEDGKVIGVNTWSSALAKVKMLNGDLYTSSFEEDFFAINIDHAISLMDRNGVKHMTEYPDGAAVSDVTEDATEKIEETEAPKETEAETQNIDDSKNINQPKSNLPLIIGIIAGVILLIAVIAIVVVVVNKNKKKDGQGNQPPVAPMPPTPPVPPMPPVNEGAGETSVLSDGAGETTVLGGGATGFNLIRKSNNEMITINKPEFVIGKERRRVDYCIADNNSVSRTHAKVRVRSGKCYITDLGSTNCTYVNDVKLSPNQEIELKSGDVIKISDVEFVFNG